MRTYIEIQETAVSATPTKKELESLTDRELRSLINQLDFIHNLCRIEVMSRAIEAEQKL